MTDSTADEQMQRALRMYAKRELRTRMKSLRNLLPQSAHVERSARACRALTALARFAAARTIAGYIAMQKELNVGAALEFAADRGQRVALPRIVGPELEFRRHRPGEPLVENDWGVREPAEDAELIPLDEIELLLVPALALDLRGHRIGYGKSYYDRLLARIPHAYAVGVVYDFQLLAEVPNEAHDLAVHQIVTDSRSLPASDGNPTP